MGCSSRLPEKQTRLTDGISFFESYYFFFFYVLRAMSNFQLTFNPSVILMVKKKIIDRYFILETETRYVLNFNFR